jgi:hypothetical protein
MSLDSLKFERADYGTYTPIQTCAFCTRTLDDPWFEIDRKRICSSCADQARAIFPVDSRDRFLRSAALGTLTAAILGLVYFYLFRATNGSWMIFGAIGLGYLVGRAMRIGSHDLGGRRYQITAAILTYCSVALGTSLAVFGTRDIPFWAYPFFVFAPFVLLAIGQFSLAALQLMFAFVGIRWAWGIMAGAPWKVTGPHSPEQGTP